MFLVFFFSPCAVVSQTWCCRDIFPGTAPTVANHFGEGEDVLRRRSSAELQGEKQIVRRVRCTA